MMLVGIDTGLASTKVAAWNGGELQTLEYPSGVVRGLVNEQSDGVYSIDGATSSLQMYSVFKSEFGINPAKPEGYRHPTNVLRRILIEHAMAKLEIKGEVSVILMQPAPNIYDGLSDNSGKLRCSENSLLNIPISTIIDPSTQPIPSEWKLCQLSTSPEAVWSIYDLAISSRAGANKDLAEFTKHKVKVGEIVAVVDIGETGTRIHYVEWTDGTVPVFHMSRYSEFPLGVREVKGEFAFSVAEKYSYRDVINMTALTTEPTINVSGVRTNVSELIDASARPVIDKMLKAGLHQLQGEVEDKTVDHVLLVGGGTHIMGGIIAESFQDDVVLTVSDPCMAPVRGLLKYRAVSSVLEEVG